MPAVHKNRCTGLSQVRCRSPEVYRQADTVAGVWKTVVIPAGTKRSRFVLFIIIPARIVTRHAQHEYADEPFPHRHNFYR